MLPPSSSLYFFTTPSGKASAGTRCWNWSKRRSGAFTSMRGPLPGGGADSRRVAGARSVDQLEDLALDLLPGPFRHPPFARGAAADVDRLAVAVTVEDARVDVGAATDRGRVAERRRHRLHGAGDPALGGRVGGGLLLPGR